MRALFVTSRTNDVDSLLRAWACWNSEPEQVTFPHQGKPCDGEILAFAKLKKPHVIFYIGANKGSGIPSIATLKKLRDIAPSINLCCDGGDEPWWPTLIYYKKHGCFDLQVTLDGHHGAPVDLVTITPVDPRPFASIDVVGRDIMCGFSGGVPFRHKPMFRASKQGPPRTKFEKRPKMALRGWHATHHPAAVRLNRPMRDRIIRTLGEGPVTVRPRTNKADYRDHADFMMRCLMILNTSWSGSGKTHHIKGRVLEAGYARCCLLESEGSPIGRWFPDDCYFLYKAPTEAAHLIETLQDDQIARAANALSRHVRENYPPARIYGEMLDRVGLTESLPTA